MSSRIGNLVLLLVAGAIYYGACVAPKQRQSLLGNKPFKSALPPSFHPPGEFFTISIDGEPQRERLDETRDGIRFRGTKYRWQKDEFLVVVLTLRGEGIGALDADQARLILAGR